MSTCGDEIVSGAAKRQSREIRARGFPDRSGGGRTDGRGEGAGGRPRAVHARKICRPDTGTRPGLRARGTERGGRGGWGESRVVVAAGVVPSRARRAWTGRGDARGRGRGGKGRAGGRRARGVARAPMSVPCICARSSPSTVTVTPDLVSDWISRSSLASLLVSISTRAGALALTWGSLERRGAGRRSRRARAVSPGREDATSRRGRGQETRRAAFRVVPSASDVCARDHVATR